MGEPQQNEPKADDLQGAGSNARAQDDSRSGVQNTPTQDDSRSGKLLLGAVTIGQAPRTDVTADIAPLLGPNVRVIEAGALDGASDVSPLAPQGGESALASRLADGTGVIVSEAKIMPLVQQAVDRVVAQGAFAVVLLCTATLRNPPTSAVPLIHPDVALAEAVVRMVRDEACGDGIAVMVPDESQIGDIGNRWEQLLGSRPALFAASPYGPAEPRIAAAEAIGRTDAGAIVLDCIGYSTAMARDIERASGKTVVLPRAIVAEAAKELL